MNEALPEGGVTTLRIAVGFAVLLLTALVVWGVAVRGIAPTRRLALLTAAAAPLWLLSTTRTGTIVAAAATAAVALLAVADLLRLPRPDSFIVRRLQPATVGLGDSADGAYRVESRWVRSAALTLHHAPPPTLEIELGGATSFTLAAGGTHLVPFTLRGRSRGSHFPGRAALVVRGELGLIQRTLPYEPMDAILVVPSLTGIHRFRLLAVQHRLQDAGIRNVRRRGQGTTFSNLREYAHGDDPRHIDWKATARRRRLVTREYALEQGQTIVIAIDAGRLMTQIAGEFPRFEHALSAALVLADVAVHSDDRVGLIVFDDAVRAFVPPARGAMALHAIRDALVPATASMVEPDYAAAFRSLAARHRRRSLIVMFTDVIDPRASRALIAHTTRSAARHLPVVVALRNDSLVATAHPAGRNTSRELYESAAAEELLLAREEALQQMRRAGVSVLDVSPERMTPAVVNRYLEIKARSAL